MTASPLYFLFLDWKQAFDSIDHNAMMVALERFGISRRALNIIYQGPTFYTVSATGEKSHGNVGSGIRQGCPLGLYLFIMVLTVLFEDLDYSLLQKGIATNTWSIGRPTYDLEYADDTLLMSVTIPQLESILRALEE